MALNARLLQALLAHKISLIGKGSCPSQSGGRRICKNSVSTLNILVEPYAGGDAWQYGGRGAPMPKRLAKKPDRNCSGGHSISQSQKPLPPYELDPMFDNPVIRNRIGAVIAKAAKKRFSER
jgi:hypothetical protein